MTGHGSLAWAQQTVPAGVAALLVGTIPIWMALFDRVAFGRRLAGRWPTSGIAVGFAGLAFLFDPFGEGSVDRRRRARDRRAARCAGRSGRSTRAARRCRSRPLVSAGLASLCGGILLAGYSVVSGEIGEATWTSDALLGARLPHRRGQLRRFHRVRLAASGRADLARLDLRVRQSDRRRRARLADPRRGRHACRWLVAGAAVLVSVAVILRSGGTSLEPGRGLFTKERPIAAAAATEPTA